MIIVCVCVCCVGVACVCVCCVRVVCACMCVLSSNHKRVKTHVLCAD